MNKKTAKALEEGIAHWKRMRKKWDCGETPWSDDCALCGIFYDDKDDCGECPVKKATGQDLCRDTPWMQAKNAWCDLDDTLERVVTKELYKEWDKESTKEIKFLESLRE